MPESVFKKKERIRPPRVHIQYEVELKPGTFAKKELPFVVGVLGDLSGQPKDPLAKPKERQFVNIDRDNFDSVLSSMQPRLAFRVNNTLSGKEDEKLSVELQFQKLEDFAPENVVKQVAPMTELLQTRDRLKDLLSRMEGNDRLEEQLQAIIENSELRDGLRDVLQSADAEAKRSTSTDGEGR